jgi:hypothetical protein
MQPSEEPTLDWSSNQDSAFRSEHSQEKAMVALNNVAQTYTDLDLFQKGLEFNLKCLAMNYSIYGENENSIQVATL